VSAISWLPSRHEKLAEPTFERVTLDTTVLLGTRNREFLAAAALGYYRGY